MNVYIRKPYLLKEIYEIVQLSGSNDMPSILMYMDLDILNIEIKEIVADGYSMFEQDFRKATEYEAQSFFVEMEKRGWERYHVFDTAELTASVVQWHKQ